MSFQKRMSHLLMEKISDRGIFKIHAVLPNRLRATAVVNGDIIIYIFKKRKKNWCCYLRKRGRDRDRERKRENDRHLVIIVGSSLWKICCCGGNIVRLRLVLEMWVEIAGRSHAGVLKQSVAWTPGNLQKKTRNPQR